MDEDKLNEFLHRFVGDLDATITAGQVVIGHRLGLYQALVDNPGTADDLARRTGCGILLDVNNVYVSACNHRLDPRRYIDSIPARHVAEIHLAGFTRNGADGAEILIDTHSRPVAAEVWALFAHAVERFGPRPTLVEWDADLPPLAMLAAEAGHAQALLEVRHALAA